MAAKKARFYAVEARNGHGRYTFIVPAQSKDDLLNTLSIPGNEVLLGVTHLKHHEVEALPDEDNGAVEFRAQVNGEPCVVTVGQQGHDYLTRQFPKKVKDVEDYYKERYADYSDD